MPAERPGDQPQKSHQLSTPSPQATNVAPAIAIPFTNRAKTSSPRRQQSSKNAVDARSQQIGSFAILVQHTAPNLG
jgi:hypothetical protein